MSIIARSQRAMKRLSWWLWWHLSWLPQNRKLRRMSGLPWGTDL